MKIDIALTTVSTKYSNFVDVFCSKLVEELPEHIRNNNYTIDIVDDK